MSLTTPTKVPGAIAVHVPKSDGLYVGSPSLLLHDGAHLLAFDVFGPGGNERFGSGVGYDQTVVMRSADDGQTWTQLAQVDGQLWSTLFEHRGDIYLMGTRSKYGDAVIRRSTDGGLTWTDPDAPENGLLLGGGRFHSAPTPVVVQGGRIWRTMEEARGDEGWPRVFVAFMLSAPVDADLLDASSWTKSTEHVRDGSWLGGEFEGWLEGNAVIAPDGAVVNVLRVEYWAGPQEKAAIITTSADGAQTSFDPDHDFVDFPGGGKKFTIRYDEQLGLYLALTNFVPEPTVDSRGLKARNHLGVISSPDLRSWTQHQVLLEHQGEDAFHAFQYIDWIVDGDDILYASRTAGDDEFGGAKNFHDSNYITVHRWQNFRTSLEGRAAH